MKQRTIATVLTLALAAGLMAVPPGAWAGFVEDAGMTLMAVTDEDSSIVSISGHTIRTDDVIFRILSPTNNLVKADQVTPGEDGTFSTFLDVRALTENGLYTIEARQGTADLYNLEVRVDVRDGMVADSVVTESNFARAISMEGIDLLTDDQISIVADAMEGSDTISINGYTPITNMDITVKVAAPNGNIISTHQIQPGADGVFSFDIMIGGPLWSQDGAYTVTTYQGQYESVTVVEVQDGVVVPEFGVMAVLILAVAIVSIVAVSARSRLSLAPRF